MSEYISRDEFEKRIKPYDTKDPIYKTLYNFAHNHMICCPSADVSPNIHGHWEPKYPTKEEMIYCQERYFCSNCKGYVADRITRLKFNFCPNCGADMREPKGEKTKDFPQAEDIAPAIESFKNVLDNRLIREALDEPIGEKGTERCKSE